MRMTYEPDSHNPQCIVELEGKEPLLAHLFALPAPLPRGPMQILPKLAEWSCRFLAPPPPPKLIPSRHERERESGREREWLPWLPIHPSIRLIKGAFFHLGNTLSTIGATEQNGRHGHIAVQIYHSRPKGLPTSNNKSYV